MYLNSFYFCWILFALILATGLGHQEEDWNHQEENWNHEEDFHASTWHSDEGRCRVANNIYLPPEPFSLFACAACYDYVDDRLFVEGTKLQRGFFSLFDRKTNTSYLANITTVNSTVWDTFSTEKAKEKWISCCHEAVKCCQVIQTTKIEINGSFCPKTWDGWECWPDAPPGTSLTKPCPWYVYFHSEATECSGVATKRCEAHGKWYINENNNEWTNYTTCGRTQDIMRVLRAHVYSMAVSVIFLLPALIIFFSYKQLQVFRIRMHRNLFITLFLNAIFVIAFERHFMNEALHNNASSALEANLIECKVIYAITKYFRVSTYMWMLCEGFYLHKLIAAAFAEQSSMKLFYAIGWGLPLLPIITWGLLRHFYADSGCWTVPYGHFEWVLFVPMLLAIVLNIGFLSNIIRILVLKLKSTHAREPTQFRRAVKATVVLVPLFGVHFVLVMYHPNDGQCGFLHIYNVVTYCIDGLQGAIISIIFCYLNNEVQTLIRRSYTRQRLVQSVGHRTCSRKSAYDSRMSISTNVSTITELSNKRNSK